MHVVFLVEHDNSCRIMIVGVDNVLYHIPGCGDRHQLRCGPEVSGGGCQIFVKVEIVENDSNCQQV